MSTPLSMAVILVAVMMLISVSFDMGVKEGRRTERQEIGLMMVKKMGYDSLEEWNAANDVGE